MKRSNQILELSENMIEDGQKPSATALAEKLSWSDEDVHRCLNILEKNGEIETYAKNILGKRLRMVSVYRN
jgi:hypothetical protein